MPAQPAQQLGGLASVLDQMDERLRAYDQRRVGIPGGVTFGSVTEPGNYVNGDNPIYPSGYELTTTAGPTGLLIVFAQSLVTGSSPGGDSGNLWVSLDGALPGDEVGVTVGYAVNQTLSNTLVAGSVTYAVTPNSAHTLSLGFTSLGTGSGDTFTWAQNFIVCWPL